MIDYLNATEYYIDENTRNTIKNSLQFPNEYFAVVIIQLSPTIRTFDLYNTFEYSNIQSGFYNIIKSLFAEKFLAFILPGDKDTLYIILNLQTKEQINQTTPIFETVYDLLKNDMEYINLSIGKSSVYDGLDGLKQAHNEASDSLTLRDCNSDRVIFKAPQSLNSYFSHKMESEFYTALLSANEQKTHEILNETLEKIKNIPSQIQRQVYNYIINIVLRVIRLKKISYKENLFDFEILNDMLNQPVKNIRSDLITLIDYILTAATPQTNSEADSSAIIKYIEKNFAFQGMSLDFLAEYFHTSQSNLSTLIKNILGIGFHEYLSTLRIEKAKSLLTSTDKNITKIFQECGFSSEQTFYRTFKKLTGQTPTEFRKNSEKENT